ncbi:hypothetical protein BH11ACT1_BH11ACT1_18120 [soil metagenome]
MSLYPYARPFAGDPFDVEPDTEHPNPDGTADSQRMVVERHIHTLRHDVTDEWDHVPVTAVLWSGIGEVVEVGPWSLSVADARLLAYSLTTLADLVDVDGPRALIRTATRQEADS